ncbi:MAG: sulfite exporter TauE/SafE family protein [Sphingobacteriales bacterium]|nr:MAG: sulfite exporter TauE/SafE family protein [Sphingobacteriales bacterium]
MIYAGYLAAILIGISLGLIGGGGSILTIPVLVYLMGIPATAATTYSLFIVGVGSLAGSLRSYRIINIKTALIFGSASIVSVLLTRRFLLPLIPEILLQSDSVRVSKDSFLMLLFAGLMILASFSMIRAGKKKIRESIKSRNPFFLVILGLFVGTVTGLLGAGGGFLIIPALVIFNKLDMKTAVATSLTIIAVNSLIGFAGSLGTQEIDWRFLLLFTAIAVSGILIGTRLSQRISGRALKVGFGWFVLCMGVLILVAEFLEAISS